MMVNVMTGHCNSEKYLPKKKKKKSIKKQENFTIDIVQTVVLIFIVKFLFTTAVASG